MNLLPPRQAIGKAVKVIHKAIQKNAGLLALVGGVAAFFAFLPARDAGLLSALRLFMRYEQIRPGMTVAAVERLMSGTYAVHRSVELNNWLCDRNRGNHYPQPTARPIPQHFTGSISYHHDLGNLDIAGVDFQNGKVVKKDIMWD